MGLRPYRLAPHHHPGQPGLGKSHHPPSDIAPGEGSRASEVQRGWLADGITKLDLLLQRQTSLCHWYQRTLAVPSTCQHRNEQVPQVYPLWQAALSRGDLYRPPLGDLLAQTPLVDVLLPQDHHLEGKNRANRGPGPSPQFDVIFIFSCPPHVFCL